MSALNTYLKNAALVGSGVAPVRTNGPTQYTDRQRQYFDAETRQFTLQKARYSSDFISARVQGLKSGSLDEWGTYRLRFADVVRASSAIQRNFDDYKLVLFESPEIEYIRPGTKIETMGNTWLAVNPINISDSSGSSVVRRCNAVWNHLDFYGNVVSEPLIVENSRANASDSDAQQSLLITKGYFNVICQYNDATRQIDTNTRMILGTGAYRVTGYSDFETEFTGDYGTVRTLSFVVRYEEPNDAIDDMVNHVAGGKTFTWDVSISAVNSIRVGETAAFSALSVRNDAPVQSSAENPIRYLWESGDESIATVDYNGVVTGVSVGETVITAMLEQNTAYGRSVIVSVTESEDGVYFTDSVPKTLSAFEDATISAAYFEDGQETDEEIVFTLSGANSESYSAIYGPKAVTVYCYGYSETPLIVTASYGDYSETAEIVLEGM